MNPLVWDQTAKAVYGLGKYASGDVVTVSVRPQQGSTASVPAADGYSIYVRYRPDYVQRDEMTAPGSFEASARSGPCLKQAGGLSGPSGSAGDLLPVEWRWDPGCAVRLPWNGELSLAGGSGGDAIEIEVLYTPCGPPPPVDPTLTLLSLTRPTQVQLPRGVWAVQMPAANVLKFTTLGTAIAVPISLSGVVPLGLAAQGTVEIDGAGTSPAPLVAFHVRVG